MPWEYESPQQLTTPSERVEHYRRAMTSRRQTLAELGWQPLPDSETATIKEFVRSRFPILSGSQPPEPHIVWDVSAIYDDRESFSTREANLTLCSLLALRRCTKPGEEVLAIDWQHDWYRFKPHAFPPTGDTYYWQVPVLPNGDAYFFFPQDFRFGIVGIPHTMLCIYGAGLLQAFAENRPAIFMKQVTWPRDPWPKGEPWLSENA